MKVSCLLFLLASSGQALASRAVYSLDSAWRFEQQQAAPLAPCPSGTWTTNLDGEQTAGLAQAQAIDETRCAETCCADAACETYQFCNSTSCGSGPPQQPSCWIGKYKGAKTQKSAGWFGKARAPQPAPPPSPSPSPQKSCTEPWCQPSFNDAGWRSLSVPHDFVVEGNFTPSGDKSHGYLLGGVGLYRKHIHALPTGDADAVRAGTHSVFLVFDGAQTHSTVYLDGEQLGQHASGYTPFQFKLTTDQAKNIAAATAGEPSVLAVKVDATKPDGWWYDGGGIYRHVNLIVLPNLHVATEGGAYLPSTVDGAINDGAADVSVAPAITVVSSAESSSPTATFSVSVVVTDSSGAIVGRSQVSGQPCSPGPGNVTVSLPLIHISNAKLWSPDSPTLFTAVVNVTDSSSGTVDSTQHTIGFRKPEWSPDTGFKLNGVSMKILGAANHQDFAGVGVAVPDSLQSHRISKLKEMGCNAWRTAHNPPTPALLDAADRLGFLVWDENHRNGQDDELRRLVLRDRNHPSIIIWSICNEILCNTNATLVDGHRLHDLFHSLDPGGARVVSANYNGWSAQAANSPLDLQGVDYSTTTYDKVHANNAKLPLISSETSSAVSDRAIYKNDPAAGHVTGYDTEKPSWGQTAEGAWGGVGQADGQGILTREFMSGGFTWTGWDYKGEPTPDAWPDINSHFGILDIAGFPKDRFYWYKSKFPQYAKGEGMVHLFPHWNWRSDGDSSGEQEEKETKKVDMWAFSNAEQVELFVNNVSLGRSAPGDFGHAQWLQVPYSPGEVRAVAFDASNKTIATQTIETTGAPAALRVSIKDGVGAGGIISGCNDVALVKVEVVDSEGRVVPTANNNIDLSVAGPAVYLGGGNGDPAEHTPDKSTTRPAFGGLLLGVFGSTAQTGTVTVTATASGLMSDKMNIEAKQPTFGSSWWCARNPEL